jgi:uncharacterized integral membrane protein
LRAVKPAYVGAGAVALLALLFVILNWGMLGTAVPVSFGFARLTVPLGAVLLGFALLLLAVFFALLVRVQVGNLAAHRRHSAELRTQKELVENAEASRYTDLRQYLQQELAALREQQLKGEQRLHEELVSTANTLSAYVGEIDERLERHFPSTPAQQP